jgi:hypothetical protein
MYERYSFVCRRDATPLCGAYWQSATTGLADQPPGGSGARIVEDG